MAFKSSLNKNKYASPAARPRVAGGNSTRVRAPPPHEWLSMGDDQKLQCKQLEQKKLASWKLDYVEKSEEYKAYNEAWIDGYHVSIAREATAMVVKKAVEAIHGPMDRDMFGRNFYAPIVVPCFESMTEKADGKIKRPEDFNLSHANVILDKLESEIDRDVKAGQKIMMTQKVGDASLKLLKSVQKKIATTLVSKFIPKGASKKGASKDKKSGPNGDDVNDLVEEAVETMWNAIVPNFDKAKASAAKVAAMSFKGAQMKSVTCAVMRDCLQGFKDAAIEAKKEMKSRFAPFKPVWPAFGKYPALPGFKASANGNYSLSY